MVITLEQPVQPDIVLGMQFHRRQPVLRSEQHARKFRGAGIEADAALRIEFADGREVGLQQFRDLRAEVCLHQLADAIEPFAGFLRFFQGEVVEPDAGMRVEHAEPAILLLHVTDQPRQHDMFQHIGKVARVIDVAVVHVR
ncbi:hypothetical protein ACVIRM_002557 [Rhizobium laguerreae]